MDLRTDKYSNILLHAWVGPVICVVLMAMTLLHSKISSLVRTLTSSIPMVIYGYGAGIVTNFFTRTASLDLILLGLIVVALPSVTKKV